MALPLQPRLDPLSPRQRSMLAGSCLLLSVLLLGLCGRSATARHEVLLTGPDQSHLRRLQRLMATATERIWVMVYVLRPEDSGMGPVHDLARSLAAAAERGLDVRVVLDQDRVWATQEVSTKHLAGQALLEKLGVRVIIDNLERRSHAKVVLIDRDRAVVGSHNWTWSALMHNREASVLLHDAAAVRRLEKLFADIPDFDHVEKVDRQPFSNK